MAPESQKMLSSSRQEGKRDTINALSSQKLYLPIPSILLAT